MVDVRYRNAEDSKNHRFLFIFRSRTPDDEHAKCAACIRRAMYRKKCDEQTDDLQYAQRLCRVNLLSQYWNDTNCVLYARTLAKILLIGGIGARYPVPYRMTHIYCCIKSHERKVYPSFSNYIFGNLCVRIKKSAHRYVCVSSKNVLVHIGSENLWLSLVNRVERCLQTIVNVISLMAQTKHVKA